MLKTEKDTKELKIFNKKYDCIISIGEACFCADFLSKMKFRTFSAPFDWLCGSTFQQRCEILANRFSRFINVEDLEKIGTRTSPEPCDIYHNKFNDITFNHDFSLNGDLQKDYIQVKEKYDKRILRLIDKLNAQKVLLVFMNEIDSTKEVTDSNIIEGTKAISEAYKNTEIDLLYIKHNKDLEDNKYLLTPLSQNAYLAEIYNSGRQDDFNGNLENCKVLFKNIRVKKSLKERLIKISKTQSRIRLYLFGVKIISIKYRH